MTSLEDFVMKIKPSLDAFLRNSTKENLGVVDEQLSKFTWSELQIFHVQILLPLVLKLEKLNGHDQDLQAGTINCVCLVVSKLYLKEVQALQTMLVIVMKQIRDCENAKTKPNLSEEIKLAAVECITMLFQRSTTDVLEQYYTQESALFLGQVLLTVVEFIQHEKYKKLVIASLNCLMSIFYVSESADLNDVVLRSQVADTLFIFLPKIVTVLFKTCLCDEKLGETLLTTAVKALARILALVFEDTSESVVKQSIDMDIFRQQIIDEVNTKRNTTQVESDNQILGAKVPREHIEQHLKQMQTNGRSKLWFGATSRKLKLIFRQLGEELRGHQSVHMRHEYAQMCCMLIQRCGNNLRENFIYMLENVIALSEDEEEHIAVLCRQTLETLQDCRRHDNLFDESAELLFDEHLTRLPRIIARCDDAEQYAEFMFLKGFLLHLSANKLQMLFLLPRNLEMFCTCLLAAADLKITRDLLIEEYALRVMGEQEFQECNKLPWRQLRNINSQRCVTLLTELCVIIGRTESLNKMVFDYFMEMLTQQSHVMNEILLIMIWLTATKKLDKQNALVELLLNEILNEKHWHLALQPDEMRRLKVTKPSDWIVDRTPGLYESAVETRTQDCDSDDEMDTTSVACVTVADAQFNILHTCIIMDAAGHCATVLGEKFECYLFRCLHKVLLKVGSSNSIIYQSANFALISMQRALKFSKTTHFIESYTDYITYHLNRILRRNPESKSAVDILTVVLQFSSRNALPHLESIFRTIREECGKTYQSKNVLSYLKVFQAFLKNISKWQLEFQHEIKDIPMQIDAANETNLLKNWLDILQRPPFFEDACTNVNPNAANTDSNNQEMDVDLKEAAEPETTNTATTDLKPELPQYINSAKEILDQVIKLVSSSMQAQQILSLECLICGISLLRDYEDELLPLVHRLWQPLVERFRQKDAIVLNRCFTLLGILALHAKEFITKKSLDDVIPFLKQFLAKAAVHSQKEISAAQTQEFKLQVKLLQEFPPLIQHLLIEGKQLNEISDVVALYLSENQPKRLQQLSRNYFKCLRLYNGPLIYSIILKKSHLKGYKTNVDRILNDFEL